jgi:hypothetical protein
LNLIKIGTELPDGQMVVAITRESVIVQSVKGKKTKKTVLSFQDVEKMFFE